MRKKVFVLTMSLFGCWMLAGCGSGEDKRTDVPTDPIEVQNADSVREMIQELQNPDEGVIEMEGFLENMEEYATNEEVGDENKETYNQILAEGKKLKQLIDSKASKADIKKKIDELAALGDKLPGDKSNASSGPGANEDIDLDDQ